MFKHGHGVLTLHAADYGVSRSFLLYDEQTVFRSLQRLGMELIAPGGSAALGGLMYFTDTKGAAHCVFHMRKPAHPSR